ncbi:MAG: tetratricopeptide repeat protein [Armatimonadota bacterium]
MQYIAQIVQAGQAFKRGEYRRALEAATQASAAAQDMTTAINELIGGGFSADDNALVAQGQRVLGQLHYALGNFTEAIPLLEQSIDVQRKMGKDSGPEYAKALSALALLYVAMGTHERAIDLLQQALRAMEATVQQTSQVFGRLGGLTDIKMDVDWVVATPQSTSIMMSVSPPNLPKTCEVC